MLFRKKIPQSCIYCSHGTSVDEDQVLCTKRGVVPIDSGCKKFCYDPCKRIPPRPRPLDFSRYKDEDFSL